VFNFEYNTEDKDTSAINTGNASGLVIEPTTKENLAAQLNAARSFFRQLDAPNLLSTLGDYNLALHIAYGYLAVAGDISSNANSVLTSGTLSIDTSTQTEDTYSQDVTFDGQSYSIEYAINEGIVGSGLPTKSYYEDSGAKNLGSVSAGSVGGTISYENRSFDTDVAAGVYDVTWTATESELTVVAVENGSPQYDYVSYSQDVEVTILSRTSGDEPVGGGGATTL
jgi:hypothetical protein